MVCKVADTPIHKGSRAAQKLIGHVGRDANEAETITSVTHRHMIKNTYTQLPVPSQNTV